MRGDPPRPHATRPAPWTWRTDGGRRCDLARLHSLVTLVKDIPARETALIICDMWDQHWCPTAIKRCAELARKMAPVIAAAQARFAGTAWLQCDSWYRNESGRIVTNWPGYQREYVQRARVFDPAEYELVPVAETAPTLAGA